MADAKNVISTAGPRVIIEPNKLEVLTSRDKKNQYRIQHARIFLDPASLYPEPFRFFVGERDMPYMPGEYTLHLESSLQIRDNRLAIGFPQLVPRTA